MGINRSTTIKQSSRLASSHKYKIIVEEEEPPTSLATAITNNEVYTQNKKYKNT